MVELGLTERQIQRAWGKRFDEFNRFAHRRKPQNQLGNGNGPLAREGEPGPSFLDCNCAKRKTRRRRLPQLADFRDSRVACIRTSVGTF